MSARIFLLLILLASAFTQFGCSTVYSRGPEAVVDSPEVASSDKWRMNLNMRILPDELSILANDAAARPVVVNNNPQIGQVVGHDVGPSLNTPSNLEFGLSADPLATVIGGGIGLMGFAKYQLLGNTYDHWQPHSHLLSVSSHISRNSQSSSGNQTYLGGPGGYPWSDNSHFTGIDAGATYGFRQNSFWLYYVGYAYQDFWIDANIHQSLGSDGSAGGDYNIPSTQGINQKTALGVVMGGETFKMDLQVGFVNMRWNQQLLNEFTAALTATIHFGSSKPETQVDPKSESPVIHSSVP